MPLFQERQNFISLIDTKCNSVVRILDVSINRNERYTGCEGVGAEKFHSIYVQTPIRDVCI
jgi:adenylylsulfate kinase-like enzyme